MAKAEDQDDDGPSSALSSPPESISGYDFDLDFFKTPQNKMNGHSQGPSLLDQLKEMEKDGNPVEDSIVVAAPKPEHEPPGHFTTASHPKRRTSPDGDRDDPGSPTKRVKGSVKKATLITPEKRRSKKWEVDYVLTNRRSPLAGADIRDILLHPDAWQKLSEKDQGDLLAMFPAEHIIAAGTPSTRPNFAALSNDDNFRYDCARYAENLQEGRHDREWLRDAWAAHERHVAGDFDAYLVGKFEHDWEEKLPDQYKPASMRGKVAGDGKGEKNTRRRVTARSAKDEAPGEHDMPDTLAGNPGDAVAESEMAEADSLPTITVAVKKLDVEAKHGPGQGD